MNHSLYHARRVALSQLTESMLRLFAWQQRVRWNYLPVCLFAGAIFVGGALFLWRPQQFADQFGFLRLDNTGLTEIRAYYGTFLLSMSLALLVLLRSQRLAPAALLVTAAFNLGCAAGRLLGLATGTGIASVHGQVVIGELVLGLWALQGYLRLARPQATHGAAPVVRVAAAGRIEKPEDVDPTAPGNIASPFDYYRLLRDQRPLYKPAGTDFHCVSRHQDVQEIARDTEAFSSTIVSVLIGMRNGRTSTAGLARRRPPDPGAGGIRNFGVEPVDVLAIQDPPAHAGQKKLAFAALAPFLRNLEGDVRHLAVELLEGFLPSGQTEFMETMAWRLPMIMALRLVGFPEQDYAVVKKGCAHAIALLSGVTTPAAFATHSAESLVLFRHCWRRYLAAKRAPLDDFTGALIRAVNDPAQSLTDEEAVSIIFQLLIAGSDSSASTMGNAVRMLIENPEIEQRLRREPERIGDFVEEVLRLESAFQGHFRVTKKEITLHGVTMPRDSRVFLMWGSANRDERFWKNADRIDLDRDNLRRHLTFGFGPHACLGRELARTEIRVVLDELLKRTTRLALAGPAPYVASLFTRTLVQLPIAFERADRRDDGTPLPSQRETGRAAGSTCPFAQPLVA